MPTETGKVETAGSGEIRVREGRDLLELYHDVVTEQFIPRMLKDLKAYVRLEQADRERQEQRRRDFEDRRDDYLGYVASVARAIRAEEAGDLVQAANAQIESDSASRDRARMLQLVIAYEPAADAAPTDH